MVKKKVYDNGCQKIEKNPIVSRFFFVEIITSKKQVLQRLKLKSNKERERERKIVKKNPPIFVKMSLKFLKNS